MGSDDFMKRDVLYLVLVIVMDWTCCNYWNACGDYSQDLYSILQYICIIIGAELLY